MKLVKKLRAKREELKGKGIGTELVTVIGSFVLTEIACIFHLRVPYFGISQTSLYAAFFIAFGYLWKKSKWNTNQWWIYVIGIISIVAEAYLIKGIVSVDTQTSLSLLYYTPIAILGTMIVLESSKWLVNCRRPIVNCMNRGLKFIGEHTLSIMALHFIAFKLVSLGYIKMNHLPIEQLEDFPVINEFASTGWGLVLYTLIGLFVPLALAWLWHLIKAKILLNIGQNE